MFVSYLDAPDSDSGLPAGGFEITSQDQIRQLRETCDYVFVRKGRSTPGQGTATRTHLEFFERRALERPGPDLARCMKQCSYQLAHATEQEIEAAREALTDFRKAVAAAYRAVRKQQDPQLDRIQRTATPLVESIERNPDAALYLIRTDTRGEPLFRHAVSCAIMGAALGRHLGFERGALHTLACGGALLDLGMMRLPEELADSGITVSLGSGDRHEFRRHVMHGVDLLLQYAPQRRDVINMVASHHERFNGSGYPEGLEGPRLDALSQVAGLVDVFSTLVGTESAGRRATPYEAMRFLKTRSGQDFEPELVRHFNDAFGSYPTGTLVELDNGMVAFVIQQSPRALITPRVQVVLDEHGQRVPEFRVLDLAATLPGDGRPGPCIRQCLESGSHGIDY